MRVFILFFYCLSIALNAFANVGRPQIPGAVLMEPTGLEKLAIQNEILTIDLRPLASAAPVEVEATYQIDNDKPTQEIPLVFVSGSPSIKDFQLWLDEHSISSQWHESNEIPSHWKPPSETPAFSSRGGSGYSLFVERAEVRSFTLPALEPGKHVLKARYKAKAALYLRLRPLVIWQFAYILAPAREWGGFKKLQLEVHAPSQWKIASTPPLKREGDTLSGVFLNPKINAVALTAQAPISWVYRPVFYACLFISALVGIGGGVFCWKQGKKDGLRRTIWHRALFGSFIWGTLISFSGVLIAKFPKLVLPDGQVNHHGYVDNLTILSFTLIGLCVIPIGFGLWMVGAYFGKKRFAKKTTHATTNTTSP